jgi:hypothetical protein
MWRSSTNDWAGTAVPWSTALEQHIPVTFLLSDKWLRDTDGGQITPWSDWDTYRKWVILSIREIQQAGIHVTYWEVYNEPDYSLPPTEASTATPERLLAQFDVAYEAIRSVLPNAQIIGPSTSGWLERPTSHSFSMAQFLDFAATNHLNLAALNWHYNAPNPQGIEDQVAEARALLSARPQLGRPSIFINEYGTEETQRIPGWDVQYLAALTNARVDSAGRSCWQSDCSGPVLDGLLAADGSSTLPVFWTRAFYSQMSGSMVATSASLGNVGVLASVDLVRSQVKVLLGYGQGCVQDPRCATESPLSIRWPPVKTQLTVRVPWQSGRVLITESRIPGSSVSPISQPTTNILGTFGITPSVNGPSVTTNIGVVADGDAWSLDLTHTN